MSLTRPSAPTVCNRVSTTGFNSRDAATLLAGATFQGVGESVKEYGRAGVAITSDNATDGVLTIEVSHDGATWGGPSRTWADTRFGQPHMWNIVEQYFRVKYVNGSTEATNLAIQVQYSVNSDTVLGHQLDETLTVETEAQIVRSVGVGQDPNGTFRNTAHPGVDDANSSSTNLTAATSLVFTGAWASIEDFAGITVLVEGAASGTVAGTLQMQFSHDGVSVHRDVTINDADVSASPPRTLGAVAAYFRVVYTAASDLTAFDIQTIYHTTQVTLVSRLDGTLSGNEDVANVRSVAVAQNEAGSYVNVGAVTKEGRNSLFAVAGFSDTFTVHLDVTLTPNGTDVAYMLVDLSDTTTWPHTLTGEVVLEYLIIEVDPHANFTGDFKIGYLKNVDGTNGDFVTVIDVDMATKSDVFQETIEFGSHALHCKDSNHFGPVDANNTLFQTDVNLGGPDAPGTLTYPSGDGDLILLVSGNNNPVGVSITFGYETAA